MSLSLVTLLAWLKDAARASEVDRPAVDAWQGEHKVSSPAPSRNEGECVDQHVDQQSAV